MSQELFPPHAQPRDEEPEAAAPRVAAPAPVTPLSKHTSSHDSQKKIHAQAKAGKKIGDKLQTRLDKALSNMQATIDEMNQIRHLLDNAPHAERNKLRFLTATTFEVSRTMTGTKGLVNAALRELEMSQF